jgi:hypothetical protein
MRCLHCGKELAVFKRLAGQEFCSDTHRRQYQEKYDQLALGRLLDERPSRDTAQVTPKKSRGPITLGIMDAPAQFPTAPPPRASEKSAPGRIAGILLAPLIPRAVQTTARVAAEIEMAPSLTPQRPRRRFDAPPAAFPQAVQVRLLPAPWMIRRSSGHPNQPRLELRSLTRAAPVVEIHVKGARAGQLEAANTALEVHIPPQFPSKEPALWRAPEREFASSPIASGPLGEPQPPEIRVEAKQNSAVAVLEAEVEREPERVPERATRPMPVTLHGVAAGRARPVQVFPALPGGTAVQAPHCDALPLRAVMILGPAVKREVRLPELKLNSAVSGGLSPTVKTTAGMVAVLALAAGFFFLKSDIGVIANAPMVDAGPPLRTAPDDWFQNFSPDAQRPRKISLLRASGDLADYRVEFESAIQSKAVGWVYRAKDPQNFYVSKLEIQRPGAEPAVVAVHYAVIDGQEQARTRVALPRGAGAGAVYKIRFQAVGNRFTTWVQDQKVDDWTDGRIKAGGTGLYSEDGERAALRSSFEVVPLMRKK